MTFYIPADRYAFHIWVTHTTHTDTPHTHTHTIHTHRHIRTLHTHTRTHTQTHTHTTYTHTIHTHTSHTHTHTLTPLHVVFVCRLVCGATLADITSLEEVVAHLARRHALPMSVVDALWDILGKCDHVCRVM